MLINLLKSNFIIHQVDKDILDQILLLFPVEVQNIEKALKYLEYWLKPNNYRIQDWNWLITKLEKQIMHWCNRYLPLARRLVLINSVLNGLPVYCFTLAQVPISIIHSMRRIIIWFLWNGSHKKLSYHLVNWERICSPKEKGGWGVKNLYYFNIALNLKTGWRTIIGSGLFLLF